MSRKVIGVEDNVHVLVFRGPLGESPMTPWPILRERNLGRIVQEMHGRNLVVSAGLDALADLIGYPQLQITIEKCPSCQTVLGYGVSGWVPDFLGVGSVGGTVAAGDTALGGEVYRKEVTRKFPVSTGKITIQTYLDTDEANGTGTQELREAGLFVLPYGGALFARFVHNLITKTDLVSVIYGWDLTFSSV